MAVVEKEYAVIENSVIHTFVLNLQFFHFLKLESFSSIRHYAAPVTNSLMSIRYWISLEVWRICLLSLFSKPLGLMRLHIRGSVNLFLTISRYFDPVSLESPNFVT